MFIFLLYENEISNWYLRVKCVIENKHCYTNIIIKNGCRLRECLPYIPRLRNEVLTWDRSIAIFRERSIDLSCVGSATLLRERSVTLSKLCTCSHYLSGLERFQCSSFSSLPNYLE